VHIKVTLFYLPLPNAEEGPIDCEEYAGAGAGAGAAAALFAAAALAWEAAIAIIPTGLGMPPRIRRVWRLRVARRL
jgi:hypothetical protein